MSFLKNFYEKIILAILLILFVGLLVFQLVMLMRTQNLNAEQIIGIPEPAPDYKKIAFSSPEYDILNIFAADRIWLPMGKRSEGSVYYTDLMSPFPLAECPYCHRMIAAADFPSKGGKTVGECPFCKAHLTEAKSKVAVVDDDMNRNGIPDKLEREWGLDLHDPTQLDTDPDQDGFTIREEYDLKTDPFDPKSHPSYATKLYVESVKSAKIGMIVKKINYIGDDPEKWEVQMDIDSIRNGRKVVRGEWPKIGSELKVLNADGMTFSRYKLIGIKKNIRDELDPALGDVIQKDYSEVTFQRIGSNDKVMGIIGRDITDSRENVIFYDEINQRNISKFIGDFFDLGSQQTGVETFLVDSIDRINQTVKIKRKDGQEFTIGKYVPKEKGDFSSERMPPRMNRRFEGGGSPRLQNLPMRRGRRQAPSAMQSEPSPQGGRGRALLPPQD